MVRKKKYGIEIFNDEFNHQKFVVEVISQTLGYHFTHAMQCTNMIELKGSYIVKTVDSKEIAETYRNILVSNGLIAKIIPL